MKEIYTDIDDTILNSISALKMFLMHKNIYMPDVANIHPRPSNLVEWLGISPEEQNSLQEEFRHSNFFKDMKPMLHSESILKNLYLNNYSFIAVSASPDTTQSLSLRKENLEKYFPNIFKKIIHVGLDSNKKAELLSKVRPSIFVDDSVTTCVSVAQLGFKTFLINQKNSPSKNVIPAQNWREICNHIKQ